MLVKLDKKFTMSEIKPEEPMAVSRSFILKVR